MVYRWSSKVLAGRWQATREEALRDALRAGHAKRNGDRIDLLPFVRIEKMADPQSVDHKSRPAVAG